MDSVYRYFFVALGILGTSSSLITFAWLKENGESMGELISIIAAALNTLGIVYFAWTRNKGEVKKLDAEGESEIVDAAQTNLEGAKLVTTMLKEQIDELRKELDIEKKTRRDAEEYFRQRIKALETEIGAYRSWAGRLVRQVIESGRVPEELEPKEKEDCNDTNSNS